MSVQSSASSPAASRLFARKATGLVRRAGAIDVLIYNINFISIGLMVMFLFLFEPAFYPGANLTLTAIFAFIAVLPTSLVFAMLAAAMPRSGGDYVYVSRILGPAWGMMSSWNNTFWWFIYGGVPSAFLARYGLGPLFRIIGVMSGSATALNISNWFVSPAGTFITGAILIVALVAIFSFGLGAYFRLQNVLFILANIGLVLTVIALLGKGHGDAVHAINRYLGPLAHRSNVAGFVATQGTKDGYVSAPFNLKWTIIPITWLYLELVFNQSSAYIGGEVKNASRLQIWSMPAAALYAIIWTLILVALFIGVVGSGLMGQLGALSAADLSKLGFSSTPIFTEVASWLSGSVIIGALIGLGFIFWCYTWLPGQIMNASRNLLAYALDGLMPGWVGRVNDRLHTPVNSIVIVGALSILALALYVFTTFFATLGGIFGFILSFIVTSIAAILFPYRKRDLFEGSPVAWRVAGIPVISIVGALSLVACLVMEWVFLSDPLSGIGVLAQSPFPSLGQAQVLLLINVAIFISGLVIYFVATSVQRGRGVDVSQAFAEIPVD